MRRLFASLTTILIAATGCFPPPLAVGTVDPDLVFSASEPTAPYGLGPHDQVSVVVLSHPELSTPGNGARIDSEGLLSLPLIGPIDVNGRLENDVRSEIEERLREYVLRPNVTISVQARASKRIYVLGHVASPGEYLLDQPLNGLQALSLSGGFLAGADRDNIALVRSVGSGELSVHLFNGATPGLNGMVAVKPGDLIFVRQSGSGTFAEQAQPILTTYSSLISTASGVVNTLHTLDYIGKSTSGGL